MEEGRDQGFCMTTEFYEMEHAIVADVECERLRDLVIVIIQDCDLWRVRIKKGVHHALSNFVLSIFHQKIFSII